MNRILMRQIKRITDEKGINYPELLKTIEKTYDEFQETQKRSDHTNSILVDEVMSLNEKIKLEMQNVQDLLNTIDQGIFTFDENMKIDPSYSTKAEIHFHLDRNKTNNLTSALNLSPNQINSFKSWIQNIYKPKALKRWKKYVNLAPLKEISVEVDGKILFLSLDYKPIVKKNQLERIMVLSTDMTKSRAISEELERQKNIQNRHVELVEAFFSNDQNSLHMFIRDLDNLEERIFEISQLLLLDTSNPQVMKNQLRGFFSDIHTIKSSSGSQGFQYLSTVCHKLEDLLELAISMPDKLSLTPIIFKPLQEEVSLIRNFWNQLCQYSESDVTISVRKDSYEKLCKEILNISSPDFPKIKESILTLHYQSDRSFSQKYNKIIRRLSQRNNLWIEDIRVFIENNCISPNLATSIDPILLHLIRNCVDHGMEEKSHRLSMNKGPGIITLNIKKCETQYQICLEDNGTGINPEKVLSAAMKNQLITEKQKLEMSNQEILNLIFLPNFSTRDSVSSVSGRGVGMYAVKETIHRLGGTISVSSAMGEGTKFQMTLPEEQLVNIKNSG